MLMGVLNANNKSARTEKWKSGSLGIFFIYETTFTGLSVFIKSADLVKAKILRAKTGGGWGIPSIARFKFISIL